MADWKSGTSSNPWGATQSALESFEKILKCSVCQQTFSDPVTLTTCGHTFCRNCCQREASMKCPECKVPIWTRDLNPSHQMRNIISSVTSLKDLIFKTTPSLSEDSQEAPCDSCVRGVHDLMDAVKEGNENTTVTSTKPIRSDDFSRRLTRRVKKSERALSVYSEDTAGHAEKLRRNMKRKDCGPTSHTHQNVSVVIQKLWKTEKYKEEKNKEATPTSSDGRTGRLRTRRVLRPRRVLADTCNVGRQDSQSEVDVDLADVSSGAGIADRLRDVAKPLPSAPVQGSRKRKAAAVFVEDVLGASKRKIVKCSSNEKRNQRGETALHQAAIKGDKAQATLLLDQGADPNCKDHAGWTPLHDASHHGHSEVVSLLLDRGALVDSPGYCNNTALHEAVANNCSQVTSLLLQRGASDTLKNKYGQTARTMGSFKWIDEIFSQTSSRPPHIKPTLRTQHASPMLNGGMEKVVLLATGMHATQKIILAKTAASLNAEVTQKFSPEVTHVVSNCGPGGISLRTYKLLCGIATGKWVVKFDWIEACSSQNQWVDETPYEVSGVCTADGTRSLASCRRARENQLFGAPGLYDGCHFYLHGSFSPPHPSKAELTSLIHNSGGNLLSREPDLHPSSTDLLTHPYHANAACSSNVFILVDCGASDQAKVSKWRALSDQQSSVAVVSVSWLLDCITQFQLLPTPC